MSEHITIGALMNTIENLTETNQRLLNENDTLRGLVAKGQGECVYCGLKAEDMSKCASGFPGCARMDDIMAAQDTEKDRQIAQFRTLLLSTRMRAEAILAIIPRDDQVRKMGNAYDTFEVIESSLTELVKRRNAYGRIVNKMSAADLIRVMGDEK